MKPAKTFPADTLVPPPDALPTAPTAPAGPIDGDWRQRERAAQGAGPGDAGDGEDEPYGDPSKVKDENPLESLGKAVSAPVRDAAGDPPARGT